MREVNLSGLDLNLLPALDALLRRRHVTQAAADVGLSQPAMSRALARLRALFGDDLLVRGSGGLVLTPRAHELAPRVAAWMEGGRGLFRAADFDPTSLDRTLRIAAADAHTVGILPLLLARVRREAPGLHIRVESYGADMIRRLEDGSLDLAFAIAGTPLPPGAAAFPLAEDRLALVMRRGHPAAKRTWTLADYGRVDHVVIAIFGDGLSDIDARLALGGVTRRIVLATPHFMAALAAVAQSDCVTTLSRALAARFAKTFDLMLKTPPFGDAPFTATLVTSAARARDPAIVWFSGLARVAAIEFGSRAVRSA